jgi:[ribosomal protein S5]-alanine N-acetyltransferase
MNKIKLKSKRLLLRLIEANDLENIHNLHSLPETDKFNTLGIPKNQGETKAIVEGHIADLKEEVIKKFTFAIELINQKQFIGLIAINLGNEKYQSAEVWYKLHADHWNNGYATEALKRVIEFGFNDLNLHRIEAGCAVDNVGSIRTLEKAGMTKEGGKRKALPLKTGWSDNFEYAILSTD